MSDRPHRRIEITLTLGADDWRAVKSCLDHLDYLISSEKQLNSGCMGGPDSGFTINVTEDPDMTNEKYHDALRRYLDEKRKVTA